MNTIKLLSEKELLHGAIDGDSDALNQLIALYSPFIKKEICMTYKHIDSADVDDICQLVCYAIFMNFTQGKYRLKSNFRSYVRTITVNKTFDFMRRKYTTKMVTYSLDDITTSIAAEDEADIVEINNNDNDKIDEDLPAVSLDTIKYMLSKLPDIQASTIELRFFQGLKFKQIANLQSAPFNTVVARFRYGIKKLRRMAEVMHLKDDVF